MKKSITEIFKGVFISYFITIVLLLFFSILLTYASLDDNNIDIGISIITVIALFLGSFYVTRKIELKGWLIGILTAAIYFIFLIILTYIITRQYGLNSNSLKLLASAVTGGVLGGIIGINSKNREEN